MLVREGLHPSSKGKRLHVSGGKKTVIDGPFAETKERRTRPARRLRSFRHAGSRRGGRRPPLAHAARTARPDVEGAPMTSGTTAAGTAVFGWRRGGAP